MSIKVSDYIIKFIQSHGVNDIFLLPGGGCIHLVDSVKKNGMNYVSMLHEQSAGIAAEAYSQFTGKFGVCLVTSGPGATNAITACAAAWLESSPMIFISGQVQTKDLREKHGYPRQFGFQQLNIVDIVKPITKYSITITDVNKVQDCMQQAFNLMNYERRGPVWIQVPLDIQSSMMELSGMESIWIRDNFSIGKFFHDSDFLYQLLTSSKNPIILLGNGFAHSLFYTAMITHQHEKFIEHQKLFFDFIKEYQIPVLTTWKAIDIYNADNDNYIGRPGLVAQKHANIIQEQADLIICIGARLDTGQTAYNLQKFGHNAKVIVYDIDYNELSKYNGIDHIIPNSARWYDNFSYVLEHKCDVNFSQWLYYCKSLKNKWTFTTESDYVKSEYINPYSFIRMLQCFIPDDAVIVVGSSGTCAQTVFQAIELHGTQRIINTQGLGSMGFGIPAAIGVAIASGKQVICIEGDGSLMMNIQQLQIVKRLNLPIKFIIYDNDGYLSIRNTQDKYFEGRHVASSISNEDLSIPNIGDQFRSYGLNSKMISDNSLLGKNIYDLLNDDKLSSLILKIDPCFKTKYKVCSKQNEDGSFQTATMENIE